MSGSNLLPPGHVVPTKPIMEDHSLREMNHRPGFLYYYHYLAKSGKANKYLMLGRRTVAWFEVTQAERGRWPLLGDAKTIWIIYGAVPITEAAN